MAVESGPSKDELRRALTSPQIINTVTMEGVFIVRAGTRRQVAPPVTERFWRTRVDDALADLGHGCCHTDTCIARWLLCAMCCCVPTLCVSWWVAIKCIKCRIRNVLLWMLKYPVMHHYLGLMGIMKQPDGWEEQAIGAGWITRHDVDWYMKDAERRYRAHPGPVNAWMLSEKDKQSLTEEERPGHSFKRGDEVRLKEGAGFANGRKLDIRVMQVLGIVERGDGQRRYYVELTINMGSESSQTMVCRAVLPEAQLVKGDGPAIAEAGELHRDDDGTVRDDQGMQLFFEVGEECIICCDNEQEVAFRPCGHAVCCKECTNMLSVQAKKNGEDGFQCPKCRQQVRGMTQVKGDDQAFSPAAPAPSPKPDTRPGAQPGYTSGEPYK